MKFEEFYKSQKGLLCDEQKGGVNFEQGSPAYWDTIKTWNAMAKMFPEKCEDVIKTTGGVEQENFILVPNPFLNGKNPVKKKVSKKVSKKVTTTKAASVDQEKDKKEDDAKSQEEKREPIRSESR